MPVLESISGMKEPFRLDIGEMRFNGRCKEPEINMPTSACDMGRPLSRTAMHGRAKKATLAVSSGRTPVLVVNSARYVSKVHIPIVASVPANVVNDSNREESCRVENDEMASPVERLVNADDAVSIWPKYTSNSASFSAFCGVPPNKQPGLRIVVKKFAQSLRGKIGFSHDDAPCQIGQRPGGVTSASPVLAFYG